MPPPLVEQLKDGGLIAAPVGGQRTQDLILGQKTAGEVTTKVITGCRFVKMIGQYGYSE